MKLLVISVHLPQSQNLKGPSLYVLAYHWLHLATIDLVGNNRENEV